ncbi:putative NADH dehydrogenase [Waddlia chondrophila 2032/99]|uniref:NADH:ubiquinone reductase (non-electrogenic) n=1 Tax=Waddlia chondrophila 2032/99 TaxID=765953 RepID=F8LEP3_9BACT|nr:putative NADH dehydrogenase [Waddlia chondrophila 2032/99]
MSKPKVIIIGGGFGGINAARELANANIDLTVIDRTNHHLFQPLLYQVATAALSPGNIALPIREILRNQKNAAVIMGEVTAIDKESKKITMLHGETMEYDYLIVATGARHSYFGNEQWEPFAPGLKTLNDAIAVRESILLAFERAERSNDPEQIASELRFVIVGGGPTGVEMAGSIAEIARKTLFNNFRRIVPENSEILIIEGTDRLLHTFPEELSKKALEDLQQMGVKVRTHTHVTNITEKGVYINEEFIPTSNVIWAAGNQASPLLKTLNVPQDRSGRAIVNEDLSIPGYSNVFVIGDAACAKNREGNPLPGIAPVAIQQGRYVAKVIETGERPPFHYVDKGVMATVGTSKAVAAIGKRCFTGLLAWFAWCFIHIFYLISFPNRLIVMMQWMIMYLGGNRHVRIIKKPIFDQKK